MFRFRVSPSRIPAGLAALVAGLLAPSAALAQADLTVFAALEPGDEVAEAGERVTVEYVARNDGNVDVDDPTVAFYLSDDAAFSDDDQFLESEDLSDLDAGESDEENEQFALPNVPDGEYFVLTVIDPFDRVPESNEDNNVDASAITIGAGGGGGGGGGEADLTVITGGTTVEVYGTPSSGVTIGGEYDIANLGGAGAPKFTEGLYLSRDRTLSADDEQLALDSIDPLGAGASRPERFLLNLPEFVGAGDYFLLVDLDIRDVVPESDETNNLGAIPFTVPEDPAAGAVDLRVPTFRADVRRRGWRGQILYYSYSVTNDGPDDAPPFRVGVYLMPVYGNGPAVLVRDRRVSSLAAGQTRSWSGGTSIPRSVRRGWHYAFAYADPANGVEETDEGNNFEWTYVYVR